MSKKVIHKQGKEAVSKYLGLGYYENIKAPLCAGAKGLWAGKTYHCHRMWKYVTCKKCLAMKEKS